MKTSECIKCRQEALHAPAIFENRVSDECLHNRYVYEYHKHHRNSPSSIPYYVGKGSIRRIFSPHDNVNRPGKCSNVHIVGERMSDVDARQAEILLVYLYGRRCNNTGPLHNLSQGGDGEATNHVTKDLSGYHYTSVLSDDRFYANNPDFYILTSADGVRVPNKFPKLLTAGKWIARKELAA